MTKYTTTSTQDSPQSLAVLRANEGDSKEIWEWRNDDGYARYVL